MQDNVFFPGDPQAEIKYLRQLTTKLADRNYDLQQQIDNLIQGSPKISYGVNMYAGNTLVGSPGTTIGNGRLIGEYRLAGGLCFVDIYFQHGSTTTMPAGSWNFSMPFGMRDLVEANYMDGTVTVFDASPITVRNYSVRRDLIGAKQTIYCVSEIDGGVAFNAPWSWAVNDKLWMSVCFEPRDTQETVV